MDTREPGFTLIELLIVISVIVILAGVAVPNLITSRSTTNERAVLATLRTILTAEVQVTSQRSLDSNQNGTGEYMSLPELAGTVNMRGTTEKLSPTVLSPSLGLLQPSGYVSDKGYLFAFYLPDASGAGVLGAPANFGNIDATQAEHSWSCVAWPMNRGATGSATFFVNHTGEILMSRTALYDGTGNTPPAGAALVGVPATTIVGGTLAVDQVGADGNYWTTMR